MRTAAAYLAKLKAENQGKTYKIQDTNHRVNASTLYRGAAGCGALNPAQINYPRVCPCTYLVPSPRYRIPAILMVILDGGSPSGSGSLIIDGGSPERSGPILDGGKP